MTVVVKLGGSLASAGTLLSWLAVLTASGRPAVVVPGGGGFADAVRGAQRRHGFSDRAAHHMALLAMDQMALMIADLVPSLRLGADGDELRTAVAAGAVVLWRPSPMAARDPDIAESWEVTSDSLAAWLARRLAARSLILVKSAPSPPPPLTPRRLAAAGLVDPAFPAYAAASGAELRYFGPGDEARLATALRGTVPCRTASFS